MIEGTFLWIVIGLIIAMLASSAPGRFVVDIEIFGREIGRKTIAIVLCAVCVIVWPVILWIVFAGKKADGNKQVAP